VISFGDRLKRAMGLGVDSANSKQVTDLLLQWGRGDRKALEAVLPLVYAELRRKARYHLQKQRPNHTLQSAALVHEVYLRLADEQALQAENRAHFVGIAAQLMRWILVDYERNRLASKRGGGLTRITLNGNIASPGAGEEKAINLMALDEALTRLAKLDSQQGQIIELRYFGGLSIEETADFLGVSTATVKRSWSSARAWLLREMGRAGAPA
jgi:RNA polymerase sigma factor (TIGR02999 family)